MVVEADDQCSCGEQKYEGVFMIECDACKRWFHGECCDVAEYEAHLIDEFYCQNCRTPSRQTIYKEVLNSHRHDPTEPHADSKPMQSGTPDFVEDLQTRDFLEGETLITRLRGQQLNLVYLNQNGLDRPVLVAEKDGLDLKVPPAKFNFPRDVERLVDPGKVIDVIDSTRQTSIKMTLNDLVRYYESRKRKSILNCISMEVSNSKLGKQIQSPYIVRKLSWEQTIWPEEKEKEPNSDVEKYCLMSAKDSYTDFHVDFGGSSVWYHIHQGRKVFYLIRPSKSNFAAYKKWMSAANQMETFFGDLVDGCYKLTVEQGSTFFIPSGWIHAVWTPVDSLVFGGNFLHNHSIAMQLQVYDMEKRAATPPKFCYPYFETLHWIAAIHLLKDFQEWKEEHKVAGGNRKKSSGILHIPPFYMMRGLKALSVSLKNWANASSKSNSASARREPIPIEEPQKLVKDLIKEVKLLEKELGVIALEDEELAPPPPPPSTSNVKGKAALENGDKAEPALKPKRGGAAKKATAPPASGKRKPPAKKSDDDDEVSEKDEDDEEDGKKTAANARGRSRGAKTPARYRSESPGGKPVVAKITKRGSQKKGKEAGGRKRGLSEAKDDDADDDEPPPSKKTKLGVSGRRNPPKIEKKPCSFEFEDDEEEDFPDAEPVPAKTGKGSKKKPAAPKKKPPVKKAAQRKRPAAKGRARQRRPEPEPEEEVVKIQERVEIVDSAEEAAARSESDRDEGEADELPGEPDKAVEEADDSEVFDLFSKAAQLKRTVQPLKLSIRHEEVKLSPALLPKVEKRDEDERLAKPKKEKESPKKKKKKKKEKDGASSADAGSLVMRIPKSTLSASEASEDEEFVEQTKKNVKKKPTASKEKGGKSGKSAEKDAADAKKTSAKIKPKKRAKKPAGTNGDGDGSEEGNPAASSSIRPGGSAALKLKFSLGAKGRISAASSPLHAGASPDPSSMSSWERESSTSSTMDLILKASADAEDKRIAQEVVESGRASPSARDAIAGMLSIGRTVVNPFPGLTSGSSSSTPPWQSPLPAAAPHRSPVYGGPAGSGSDSPLPLPSAAPSSSSGLSSGCGSLMASSSLANPLSLAAARAELGSATASASAAALGPKKAKRKPPLAAGRAGGNKLANLKRRQKRLEPFRLAERKDAGDDSEGEEVKQVHQDDDYVYTPLDDSDGEGKNRPPKKPKKRPAAGKRAGAPASAAAAADDDGDDSTWNTKAKVPAAPKPDRPHREGTLKTWAEKGLEEARKAGGGGSSSSSSSPSTAAKADKTPKPSSSPPQEPGPSWASDFPGASSLTSPSSTVFERHTAALLFSSSALSSGGGGGGGAAGVRKDARPGFRPQSNNPPKSPSAAADASKQRRPKKGMATAKQRLGKILKIHKMLY